MALVSSNCWLICSFQFTSCLQNKWTKWIKRKKEAEASQASPLPVISVGLEFLLDTTVVYEADRHKNKFGPGSDKQYIKLCSLPPRTAERCTCKRRTRADALREYREAVISQSWHSKLTLKQHHRPVCNPENPLEKMPRPLRGARGSCDSMAWNVGSLCCFDGGLLCQCRRSNAGSHVTAAMLNSAPSHLNNAHKVQISSA